MSRGITVDVIGVDMAGDHSLATQVHNYRRADDPASLEAAIKETFAETPQDDPNAAEEDYELVAAFPDDMATEVIKKLTLTGNHPIGELPQVVIEEDGTIVTDDDGNVVMKTDEGMGFGSIILLVTLCIVGVVVVLGIIIKVLGF
jgi:hypothetical protein